MALTHRLYCPSLHIQNVYWLNIAHPKCINSGLHLESLDSCASSLVEYSETKMAPHSVTLLIVVAVLFGSINAAISTPRGGDEPNYQEFAKMARFLVHKLGV